MSIVFKLEDAHRQRLLACWKRKTECRLAVDFLLDVEKIVTVWLQKLESCPPSTIKEQIDQTHVLRTKAEEMLTALNNIPEDVAAQMDIYWLHAKYGDKYFRLHAEAYRKDKENNAPRRMIFMALSRALAPSGTPVPAPEVTEVSKLPPDFIKQKETTSDFLRVLVEAATKMNNVLIDSKQWRNKAAEKDLLRMLAISYERHFGKLPSAANARKGQPESASPFRKFVAALSTILKRNLGADIIREVINGLPDTVSIHG